MSEKRVVKAGLSQRDSCKCRPFSRKSSFPLSRWLSIKWGGLILSGLVLVCTSLVWGQGLPAEQVSKPVQLSDVTASPTMPPSEINAPPPTPRGLSIYVNDFANLLSAHDKMRLQRKLQALDEAGLAQISVLILPDTVRELSEFAPEIMNAWDIQHYKRKDGLLILVNAQRLRAGASGNRIFAATGYRLESTLPDAMIGRILDTKALPAFENGNYSAGVTEATLTMADIVAGDKELQKAYAPHNAHNPDWMVILFLVVLFVMVSNILNRQRRRNGDGGFYGGGGYYGGGWFGGGGDGGGFGGGFGGGGDSSGGGGSGR